MGNNKHSGGGKRVSKMIKHIKGLFKRNTLNYDIGDQQGDSDKEPDEEIPPSKQRKYVIGHQRGDSDEEEEDLREADRRYHELAALRQPLKGGNSVKHNKRSGRKTRRKTRRG